MQGQDLWNHNNYAVAPWNLQLLEECLADLFPWELWVKRADLIGFRFSQVSEKGMVFFRPSESAGELTKVIERLRKTTPQLDMALVGMDSQAPDLNDHNGFIVEGVDEWERRLAKFHLAATERPDWQLSVIGISRPADPNALTERLYQAWLRIGLLGPIRNTFEMQCLNAE